MMAKQDSVSKVHLSSFDDLFQTDESREDLKRERLMEIPISLIHDFPDHPYKVKDDENMFELVESIKTKVSQKAHEVLDGTIAEAYVDTGVAWPFENDQYISSRFGTRVDPISGEIKTHGGTDIAAPLGTPILAAADGIVVTATWHNSYGYYVKIKHDDTYSTLYAHCSALHVSAGQTVKQGQVIADCGSTGYSTGPHCHFEVIQNGVRVDALMFFNSK